MARLDLGSITGPIGPQGPKPTKGVDYYTEEEKQQFTTETIVLITAEGEKQVKAVSDKSSEITTIGDQKLEAINQAGTTHTETITTKGNEITTLADEKITAITETGTNQVSLVTAEGTKQTTAVTNKGAEQTKLVTTEGSKQVGLVTSEGAKVIEQVKTIIGENPQAGNAITLGGKSRPEFDKEIQGIIGQCDGKFPLTIAEKGKIYLDTKTGKNHICILNYDGATLNEPNTENFIEISLASLDKRLNSFKAKKYGVKFSGSNPVGVRTYDAVGMVANVGVDDEIVVNDFDKVSFYNRPVCCGHHDSNGNFLVHAYEGEPGFARDGSNGEVYYECTPFYWNGSYEEPVVSEDEFEGSILAPMFNNPVDKVYLPCYFASLVDGKYVSRSGLHPEWDSLNKHMKNCRATNTHAHTETIKAHMSEYVLQLVEFATKDLQTIMMGASTLFWGDETFLTTIETTNQTYIVMAKEKAERFVVGQTIVVYGEWTKFRIVTRIEDHDGGTNSAIHFDDQEPLTLTVGKRITSLAFKTGTTDNVKASSGSAVSNTDGKHPCKWRGKEDPWAGGFSGLCDIIRKIEEDGKHYIYWLSDPKKYNDGTINDDYVKLNYNVSATEGYAKTLGVDKKYPFAAITDQVGASSTTYLGAYYYTNTNPLTVAFVGGLWDTGRGCSPVCFDLDLPPSHASVSRLARLFVTAV